MQNFEQIEIKANVFYTSGALRKLFKGVGVDWDALCGRIRPLKVAGAMRAGFLGAHVLEAMERSGEVWGSERRKRVAAGGTQRGTEGAQRATEKSGVAGGFEMRVLGTRRDHRKKVGMNGRTAKRGEDGKFVGAEV